MRKFMLLFGLLVLALGAALVSAADSSSAEPQPGTPEDNECYPGGVLYREANQDGCPTEWHWKAGWFLARYNRGLITREDFPTEFASVLPAPDDNAPPVRTICYDSLPNMPVVICLSSDQTGTWKNTLPMNQGGYSWNLIFMDNPVVCPATYLGGAYNGVGGLSFFVVLYRFTNAELAELGLKDKWCSYDAV
jgi:hypothetical protein